MTALRGWSLKQKTSNAQTPTKVLEIPKNKSQAPNNSQYQMIKKDGRVNDRFGIW
jgi:hypothetical protein